jgi:hypothetical protein
MLTASEMGRLGGLARARKLPRERLVEISRKAGLARAAQMKAEEERRKAIAAQAASGGANEASH